MKTIYDKYMTLPINKGLLCLEDRDITTPYFCYPVNAKPIGFEGCILYCFLPEYGEMVFACNPETCANRNVYPLAAKFEDFIRLILACGTVNPVEQIVWMDKCKFEEHMSNEKKSWTETLTRQNRRNGQPTNPHCCITTFLFFTNCIANFIKNCPHNNDSCKSTHKSC